MMYTVVGYYADTEQGFTEAAEGSNMPEAVTKVIKQMASRTGIGPDGFVIVDVLLGAHTSCRTGDKNILASGFLEGEDEL